MARIKVTNLRKALHHVPVQHPDGQPDYVTVMPRRTVTLREGLVPTAAARADRMLHIADETAPVSTEVVAAGPVMAEVGARVPPESGDPDAQATPIGEASVKLASAAIPKSSLKR